MVNERRLIDVDEEIKKIQSVLDEHQNDKETTAYYAFSAFVECLKNAPTVDAVVLPHPPRPMLKDCNPYNTDVYCPECGINLSGYYGDEPLPFVTCFNCGEILDPKKAITKMDGGNEDGK